MSLVDGWAGFFVDAVLCGALFYLSFVVVVVVGMDGLRWVVFGTLEFR